jgi:hypothetical protein
MYSRTKANAEVLISLSFYERYYIITALEPVEKLVICHPEFISGSHNILISLDAETLNKYEPERK